MIVCSRLAPVARTASIGPGEIDSTCSEYSLASAAAVCRASASEPAKGPAPTQTTNTMAITSGSMRSEERRVGKEWRARAGRQASEQRRMTLEGHGRRQTADD